MDNQQNNQNNNPEQQPQPPAQTPPPMAPAPFQATQKSSKMPLVLAIVGGGVFIIILLVLFIALPAFASIQQRAKAIDKPNQFFVAAEQGNNKAAYPLFVESDTADTQQFVDSAIKAVGKDCAANGSSLTIKDGANDVKTARIKGTCKSDGATNWEFNMLYNSDKKDWVIGKMVFSGGRDFSQAETSTTPTALTCLDPSSVNVFGLSQQSTVNGVFYSGNVFFLSDSTTYEFVDITPKKIQEFATFYKQNSSSGFKFYIKGSVNEARQSDVGKKLASDRASKLKSGLLENGVPSDRIVTEEPISIKNAFSETAARTVTISIKEDADCGQSTTGSSL